jgi:hypothetical protein
MSLRVQMLQVAAASTSLLSDSAQLIQNRLLPSIASQGHACDRAGNPDIYYTLFALSCLECLRTPWPKEPVQAYLNSMGDGDNLDFVHLGALARCWAFLDPKTAPPNLLDTLSSRLEEYRKPDGGYEADPRLRHGTAYGAFVALGAYQDLNRLPPRPLELARSLQQLRSADGAWSNVPNAPQGATNATAGAIVLLRELGLPPRENLGNWLLAQLHPQGGFLAIPGAPLPDLLSTATALHALAALERRLPSHVHEACLDFIDSLWSAEGGFHGHWADDHLDAEYTFYGLLALGHLALS